MKHGLQSTGLLPVRNLWSLWGWDTQRTTSIRGKHPVETAISTLHQRGGTGRYKRTEIKSEREQRKKLNKVNKAFEGCSTSHLLLQDGTHTALHTDCNISVCNET